LWEIHGPRVDQISYDAKPEVGRGFTKRRSCRLRLFGRAFARLAQPARVHTRSREVRGQGGKLSRGLVSNRERWPAWFSIPQVAPGDLDIAVLGQLPPANLSLGNQFKPSPVEVVRFKAALWRWLLIEQILENATRYTNDTMVFADTNAELYGGQSFVPARILWKGEKHQLGLLGTPEQKFSKCSHERGCLASWRAMDRAIGPFRRLSCPPAADGEARRRCRSAQATPTSRTVPG